MSAGICPPPSYIHAGGSNILPHFRIFPQKFDDHVLELANVLGRRYAESNPSNVVARHIKLIKYSSNIGKTNLLCRLVGAHFQKLMAIDKTARAPLSSKS